MLNINLLSTAVTVSFLAISCIGMAQGEDSDTSTFVASEDASPADYGACPSPEAVCYYYHGSTAVITNYCIGYDCFVMTYFEQARAVAGDDEGAFPRTFLAWFDDKKGAEPWVAWSAIPCVAEKSGNKFNLVLPAQSNICGAGLLTPEAAYYWHAVSNPVTGCLAIGECKLPLIYEPPNASPTE